ncbi:hypothetical protein EJ08DRAFT_695047 [Tothia fuscella]|uniref:Ribosomal RNA-processing protein 40 n=1 Tax=Tothia fuscella TaxID=1048955 RepID=A0A9P4NWJ9_9PEZI|nr:hypothetical protein EJ08DRAFT_695047 [Tothia fuscella]
METTPVLPGDILPSELIPHSTNKAVKLGPGLRHIPPSTVKATISGTVTSDLRKNAIWIEYNGGRYIPTPSDLIIAQILRSAGEHYTVQITPHYPPALLPHLSFEGATKKTRPQLKPGDLIYARIAAAPKHADIELECFNSQTGKGEGLGPLKGGMCFDVSVGFAREVIKGRRGGVVVLEELSEKLGFEVAVGRNGRLWVEGGEGERSGGLKHVIAVGRCLQVCDEKGLDERGQRELVRQVLKGL